MKLNGPQTRLYWALLDSIWMRSPDYAPYMTRLLVIRACCMLDPDASIYDVLVVADCIYQRGMCKE